MWYDEKQADVDSGRLAPRRVSELRRYEDRGYLDCFEDVSILDIDKSALVRWIRHIRKTQTVGEKTIKNVLGDIAQFLGWLKDQGDIEEVPTIPYRQLKLVEYQPQIPEADTAVAVLAAIPAERRGIFLARSRMGFRPSEARRLNVSDLRRGQREDLLDAHIALPPRSSKKRRGRILQLHPEVAAWLLKHGRLDRRFGAEPLFPNAEAWNDEKRWTATSERRTLERAYKVAGVEHIRPNELGRHFFGTHAVSDLGVDIYPVQEWMGHSGTETTQRYAKLRAVPIARVLGPKKRPDDT